MNSNKWLIIVDYQKTFADKKYKWSYREIYVNHWESLVENINLCMDRVKQAWWQILASREEHPEWHMYFASSYTGKFPITKAMQPGMDSSLWELTLKEVENWTEWENNFTATAKFTLEDLRETLRENWWKITLWPDHCVKDTVWAEYFSGLNDTFIDHEVIKWTEVWIHPYTAFWWVDTNWDSLETIILNNNIDEVDIVWLAGDYCVFDTVKDAIKIWLKVNLILNWVAGVSDLWYYKALKYMDDELKVNLTVIN